MNAIEIINFMKQYRNGKIAVEDLNLSIPTGSFFGFLGPNGAGKTTTVNYIAGLIRKSRGMLKLFGEAITEDEYEYKRRIGVVLEKPLYLDRLTGEEYIHFVGRMYGLNNKVLKKRANELFDMFELEDSKSRQIKSYSAGMKKKISLSAALIHDPDLLILDEPFEGIDVITSKIIKEILNRIIEKGCTILLTSHMLEVVEKLCDRVAIINKGKIVFVSESNKIRDLFENDEMAERDVNLEDIFLNVVGSKKRGKLSWLE